MSKPHGSEGTGAAAKPELSQPAYDSKASATSQGFYAALEPAVLRRSLILSASASGFGAMFFTIIQGTVFNFFLEDLSLKDRLPFFMALWCIGAVGNLIGSWIQDRWGCRKTLFLWTIGGSRTIWFLVAFIPILWPHLYAPGPAFKWLTGLTLFFYFTHALGNTAWLSWMSDLVPLDLQGKYWSLRQVFVSLTGGAAGLAAGYFLQANRNPMAYAIIFSLATVCGLVDAMMFLGVEHRRPRLKTIKLSFFQEFRSRIKEVAFRRLCGVYLLSNVANWIMAPTCFYFMRQRVGMDPYAISLAAALGLAGFTAFSLLWGKFSDHHGHRGSLVMCLLLQASCPIFYFFAHHGDDYLPALAIMVGSIGWCGVNLFMNPMLFHFTRDKSGGQAMGIAVFTVIVNLANFAALMGTSYMYQSIGFWIGKDDHSVSVYFVVMVIGMTLRTLAALLASLLPARNPEESEPGTIIAGFVTTNPIRATFSMIKYVVGHEPYEGGS